MKYDLYQVGGSCEKGGLRENRFLPVEGLNVAYRRDTRNVQRQKVASNLIYLQGHVVISLVAPRVPSLPKIHIINSTIAEHLVVDEM